LIHFYKRREIDETIATGLHPKLLLHKHFSGKHILSRNHKSVALKKMGKKLTRLKTDVL